ncbi:MAG: hypothetical protein KDJ52_00090 [Anaerolineae bacterium]|nr:hypothetical protein [Anaerolineae bacterium]
MNFPIDEAKWGQCPVCRTRFQQPTSGRKRIYCSDNCRKKQFRRTKNATKLTDDERQALIERHLSIGDWRYSDRWPAWPRYTCLVCGRSIGSTTPAWYDANDFNQVAGVHRRHICTQCHPPVEN